MLRPCGAGDERGKASTGLRGSRVQVQIDFTGHTGRLRPRPALRAAATALPFDKRSVLVQSAARGVPALRPRTRERFSCPRNPRNALLYRLKNRCDPSLAPTAYYQGLQVPRPWSAVPRGRLTSRWRPLFEEQKRVGRASSWGSLLQQLVIARLECSRDALFFSAKFSNTRRPPASRVMPAARV